MVAYVGTGPDVINGGATTMWWIQTITVLTAETMFVTWLGERITDRGIGNVISLIITVCIIAGLPGAF